MKPDKVSIPYLIALLISIGVLALLIWKAVVQPLVYDEATTFFLYALPGDGVRSWWITALGINDQISANNHIAYTLTVKTLLLILPPDEWILRLPSILAFPFYILGVFRLGKNLNTPVKLLWILAFLNPFFLEFFSLARGYAPFMALIIWSFYYLNSGFESMNSRHLVYALLLSELASLFYLGGLPLALAISAISLLAFIRSRGRWAILLAALPLAGLMAYGIVLSRADELYFGAGTLATAWDSIALHLSDTRDCLLGISLLAAILAITWALKKVAWSQIPVLTVLLLFSILILIAQHYIFGTPWPQQRTAIPFLLLLLATAMTVSRSYSNLLVAGLFTTISVLTIGRYSLYAANVELWSHQQVPKAYINEILASDCIPTVAGAPYANLTYNYMIHNRPDSAVLFSNSEQYELFNWLILPRGNHSALAPDFNIALESDHHPLVLYKKTRPTMKWASHDPDQPLKITAPSALFLTRPHNRPSQDEFYLHFAWTCSSQKGSSWMYKPPMGVNIDLPHFYPHVVEPGENCLDDSLQITGSSEEIDLVVPVVE